MDNERPIEKLLRRYAKKRREETGAPLDMHPATRRLLQGEVRRRFPQTERRESAGGFLSQLRPRLAFTLCMLALVAICAFLVFPELEKSEREGKLARADNELKPAKAVPNAVEADALKPAPAEAPPLFAPATVPLKQSAGSSAARRISFDVNRSEGSPSRAPLTTNHYYAARELTLADETAPEDNRLVQKFVKTLAAPVGTQTKAASAATPTPVLNSFEFEQRGNRLRVVDDDGSTYSGSIEPAVARNLRLAAASLREEKANKTVPETPQNYTFLVFGTNHTLKQPVVFSGNLMVETNLVSTLSGLSDVTNPASINYHPGSPPVLLNSTISGKAQVGSSAVFQINAVPAKK